MARLGIDVRKPPHVNMPPSLTGGGIPTSSMSDSHYNPAMGGGGSIYNRIPGDTLSEKNSILSGTLVGPGGGIGKTVGIYGSSSRMNGGQPSMTGSLSSIVHRYVYCFHKITSYISHCITQHIL